VKPLLMISLLGLLACSNQPVAPALPDTPTLPNSVETPKAPQSATNIMRIQDIDFGSYSRDLAKWVGLELGESDQTVTPKIESYFSPQGGSVDDAMDSQRLKTETEFSTFGAEGGKVTLVERINIKDDSIQAEQFYAIFKAEGDDFTLADYGMKIKCHRGANTQNWQTELCP